MQDGVGKEQDGTFRCFLDTVYKSFVALLAACQPLVNRFKQVFEVKPLPRLRNLGKPFDFFRRQVDAAL